MKNLKLLLFSKFDKLKNTGFFSIFMSSVFAKIIAFLGNIIIVKILSKNDYGIYSYAINAMTMLYIFNDFGASNAALQSLTEEKDNKEKQKNILKYALKLGLIGSIFSGMLILCSPLFYPFEIMEAKYLTPILFLIPFLTNANSFVLVTLRANLENKKFAILNFSQTFFNYFFLIILSYKYGIMGAIVSQYCYTGLELLLALILSRKLFSNVKNEIKLEKTEKKEFIKYSFTTQLNNTLSAVLMNIDIFLIGIILGTSDSVASYKVATTIPMALAFLPNCIMIYILPYFVLHNKDFRWIKNNCLKLIKYGSIVYGLVTIILFIFAELLFNILYGIEYSDSVITFRVLLIGFFFNATFRIPINNILYSMRKLNVNLIITICSACFNLIFNIIFIKLYGINGAAITTCAINVLSSIVLVIYAFFEVREKINR